jgi:catechol 2,3-dioxygenase-like lactoylglutathione lyase family enzyme
MRSSAGGVLSAPSGPSGSSGARGWVRTLRFAALSDTTLASFDLIAFVSTTNPARAEKFYADALGLQLVDQSPFALVFDAHGTMLRVTVVEQLDPAPNTVLGWSVADISKATRALVARGVVFLRYESMRQDAQGIWQSPSGAMIAWFTDPDGNVLSLTQF